MSPSGIPSIMEGVLIKHTGGPEVLEYAKDIEVPVPKTEELLIKNEYIGVNYIDTYFRTGLYGVGAFPCVLGCEAAGVVVARGPSSDDHGIKVGDRVAWIGARAYAQYSVVSSTHVVKIPDGITTKVAAASMTQGLTALTMICESHKVERGEWILVHAAAGGVGLWLCQLLKAVGARVIGVASTPEKLERVASHGVEVLINYTKESVLDRLMEATGGTGVAAVFDGVGKETFEESLKCLARKGTMISFGNASGPVPPFTINRLSEKNIKLVRPALLNYIATREEWETRSLELFQHIINDKIDVNIHKVYPLTEIMQAHRDLEGRKAVGKLLLTLEEQRN